MPAGAGADLQKTEEAVHLWFSCVAQLRDVSKAMFLCMRREVFTETDTLFFGSSKLDVASLASSVTWCSLSDC